MTLSKEIQFSSNMEYGVGFDDLKGETRGIIFDHASIQLTDGLSSQGQTGFFFMKRVDGAESLYKSLNVSAEVSGRYGLFSADAKMEFMETAKFNSQSTFLIARVQIKNRQKQFFKANIKPEVIDLLKNGNDKKFRERYGDYYIQGITDGGEFSAIVEIKCFSKEEETKIATALEASYGTPLAGVELDVSVAANTVKSVQHKEIKICCMQLGGKGPGITFETTVEGLIEKAKNFALTIGNNNAVPYMAHVKSYKTLELPEVNLVAIQAKEDALNDCAKKRLKYLMLLNDIDYYDNNATLFEPPVIPDEKLDEWRVMLTGLKNAMTSHATKVADDFSFNDFFVETINGAPANISEIKMPKRLVIAATASEIEMPNLLHMELDRAVLELKGLPLVIDYRAREDAAATKSIVSDQFPKAGTKVAPETTVAIFYSHPKIAPSRFTSLRAQKTILTALVNK